jgi:putative hydrolase of the HAD superfamily
MPVVVSGVVLWDFDGTLAWRPGLWGGCVLEVLDEQAPGHTAELETVRRAMRAGFPWHDHARPHPELSDPEAWWRAVTQLIADAIRDCVAESRVAELAHAVARRYADGTRGWRVFDDTRAGLGETAAAGLRNVVVSNHIPELETLVTQLGLGDLVERVFSSACTGYEKPHPEAFRIALRAEGNPRRRWMVGDNPLADVEGAEALGIPAILVRTSGSTRSSAVDVATAARMIVAESAHPRRAGANRLRTAGSRQHPSEESQ